MKEYRDALKKYSPSSNPDDAFNMYGWTVAQTMAKALEGMKEPTRKSLMESVRNLDLEIGTMLPNNKIQTTPDDGYPDRGHADHGVRREQLEAPGRPHRGQGAVGESRCSKG